MSPQVAENLLVILRASHHGVARWIPQGRLCQIVTLFLLAWLAVLFTLIIVWLVWVFFSLCVCVFVQVLVFYACECWFLQALLDLHGEWAETKGPSVGLQRRLCCLHLPSVLWWHSFPVFFPTLLKQFTSFRPVFVPSSTQISQHSEKPVL